MYFFFTFSNRQTFFFNSFLRLTRVFCLPAEYYSTINRITSWNFILKRNFTFNMYRGDFLLVWTFDFFIFFSLLMPDLREEEKKTEALTSWLHLLFACYRRQMERKQNNYFWFVHAIVLSAWKQLHQQLEMRIEPKQPLFVWLSRCMAATDFSCHCTNAANSKQT